MMNYSMSCLKFVYDISVLPNMSLISDVAVHLQFQGNISIFWVFVAVVVKWFWSCGADFLALDSFWNNIKNDRTPTWSFSPIVY